MLKLLWEIKNYTDGAERVKKKNTPGDIWVNSWNISDMKIFS